MAKSHRSTPPQTRETPVHRVAPASAVPQEVTAPDRSQWTSRQSIASHLASRPRSYLPEDQKLDQLLNGEITDDIKDDVLEEACNWIYDFLPELNWWIVLTDLYFGGGNPLAISHHREVLKALQHEVLVTYGPAQYEASFYLEPWPDYGTAILELLKKFRTYTKYVMAVALEAYPDIILERVFRENLPVQQHN